MVLAPIPPLLANGDRLDRAEFERRYCAMPHLKKAELVEGIVTMASPLRIRSHGEPHGLLNTWLGYYRVFTPKVMFGIEPTVRMDINNEPQPDAVLFIPGKQAVIDLDDYISGAPELIVEISASTVAIDLHAKKQAYCRNKVQEYLVWRVLEGELDWFVLVNGKYVRLQPNLRGIIQSNVFPGLWLSVQALLSGEMKIVLAVLQEGMDTIEYHDFV